MKQTGSILAVFVPNHQQWQGQALQHSEAVSNGQKERRLGHEELFALGNRPKGLRTCGSVLRHVRSRNLRFCSQEPARSFLANNRRLQALSHLRDPEPVAKCNWQTLRFRTTATARV